MQANRTNVSISLASFMKIVVGLVELVAGIILAWAILAVFVSLFGIIGAGIGLLMAIGMLAELVSSKRKRYFTAVGIAIGALVVSTFAIWLWWGFTSFD